MNASFPISSGAPAESAVKSRAKRSWVVSLTGVCFVFGALLAMQLRAIQQVNANQVREKQGVVLAQQLADQMKVKAAKSERESVALKAKFDAINKKLAQTGTLSKTQLAALGTQIKDLQTVAGLTPVNGPGVRIVMSDNPGANQGGESMALLPGLVHDYDLQQVVNELRAAKADAIAIRGAGGEAIRVTGYTPIRCVGPVIYINWEPVAAPFTLEAIGEPKTLNSALAMPGGIVDILKNNQAIGVKITPSDSLELPAATGGAPKLRVAKAAE